jgi:ferric-chelate reductase
MSQPASTNTSQPSVAQSSTMNSPKPKLPNLASVYAVLYPEYVGYVVAVLFTIVVLGNMISIIERSRRKRSARALAFTTPDIDERPKRSHSISWRRLHTAILNMWRIVLYRSVIQIGSEYTINLAEVLLVCIYVATILGGILVNCTN